MHLVKVALPVFHSYHAPIRNYTCNSLKGGRIESIPKSASYSWRDMNG